MGRRTPEKGEGLWPKSLYSGRVGKKTSSKTLQPHPKVSSFNQLCVIIGVWIIEQKPCQPASLLRGLAGFLF